MKYFTTVCFVLYSTLQLSAQCVQNINVTNQTTTGTIEAASSITTSGTVTAISSLYSAPMIILNPGFCVPGSTTFETDQSGCIINTTEDGSCAAPYTLTCGTTLNLTSVGGNSNFDSYGGIPIFIGPERIHKTTIPGNTTINLTLFNFSSDLDLLIAIACSNSSSSIRGAAVTDLSIETITYTNNSSNPLQIYIIVDNRNNTNGSSYSLSCSLN